MDAPLIEEKRDQFDLAGDGGARQRPGSQPVARIERGTQLQQAAWQGRGSPCRRPRTEPHSSRSTRGRARSARSAAPDCGRLLRWQALARRRQATGGRRSGRYLRVRETLAWPASYWHIGASSSPVQRPSAQRGEKPTEMVLFPARPRTYYSPRNIHKKVGHARPRRVAGPRRCWRPCHRHRRQARSAPRRRPPPRFFGDCVGRHGAPTVAEASRQQIPLGRIVDQCLLRPSAAG